VDDRTTPGPTVHLDPRAVILDFEPAPSMSSKQHFKTASNQTGVKFGAC
jgi:hypothetical protein